LQWGNVNALSSRSKIDGWEASRECGQRAAGNGYRVGNGDVHAQSVVQL